MFTPARAKIRFSTLMFALFWSLGVGSLWFFHLQWHSNMVEKLARESVEAFILKDITFRHWIASHGGVYVPVTSKTPPNPYLTLPNRDVYTTTGTHLTLINPAYMTRQVHQIGLHRYGIQAHITSLTPIRPKNQADPWETNALKTFQLGHSKYSTISPINEVPHLRLMRPLYVTEHCLPCHRHQGYEIGDIRGGISASVPLAKYQNLPQPTRQQVFWLCFSLWLFGIGYLAITQIPYRPLPKALPSYLSTIGIPATRPAVPKTTRHFFFITWLPLLLITAIITAIPIYYDYQSSQLILRTREQQHTEQIQEAIRTKLKSITSDLMVLSTYPELRLFIETGDAEARQKVEDAFLSFSANKGLYDQVRFIDDMGMEKIRINYQQGMPTKTDPTQLQRKQQRYYFNHISKLAAGEIYISPLDLNIEHGQIEHPYKPTIRFATPIYNFNGKKRGVVMLNYLAEQMLNNMIQSHNTPDSRVMLLNRESYWFKGLKSEEEWGFILKVRKTHRFDSRYSSEWDTISHSESGQFYTHNGLFTYTSFYPLVEGIKNSSGSGTPFIPSKRQLEAKQYVWKIIVYVPGDVIRQTYEAHVGRWTRIWFFIAFLTSAACLYLTRVRQQREEVTQALATSEIHYRAVVEDQSELICRFKPDGTIVFANKAMCRYHKQGAKTILGLNFPTLIQYQPKETIADGQWLNALSPKTPTRSFEHQTQLANGQMAWQQWTERGIFDKQGQLSECQSVGRDITHLKNIEDELRLYAFIVNNSSEVMALISHDYLYKAVSDSFCRVHNMKREAIIGQTMTNILGHTFFTEQLQAHFQASLAGKPTQFERWMTLPGVGARHFDISYTLFKEDHKHKGYIVSVARDTTEREKAAKKMQAYAATKTALLEEVNHRVKNNLTAIIGMLYKEQDRAEQLNSSPYLAALNELVGRIEGLSTVHTMLSSSGWHPLSLADLALQIITGALHGVDSTQQVEVEVVPSELKVNSRQAHSLGIIFNELTTNTIKHGLSTAGPHHIRVDFKTDYRQLKIIFHDNGPGFPPKTLNQASDPNNIGLELIQGIVTKNLNGKLILENQQGAQITLCFHLE